MLLSLKDCVFILAQSRPFVYKLLSSRQFGQNKRPESSTKALVQVHQQRKKAPRRKPQSFFGAVDGTWTHTSETHAPQTCLSANSSTTANIGVDRVNVSYYSTDFRNSQYFFEKIFRFFFCPSSFQKKTFCEFSPCRLQRILLVV